eukprot:6199119-Pleurochrysis_carterae.AAC.1
MHTHTPLGALRSTPLSDRMACAPAVGSFRGTLAGAQTPRSSANMIGNSMLERFREHAGRCARLPGTLVFDVVGGTNGSGLDALPHELLEHLDVPFMVDNKTLYHYCHRDFDIERPPLVVSVRSDGVRGVDAANIQSNLAPCPRTRRVVPPYAPVYSAEEVYPEQLPVAELIESIYEPTSIRCKMDAHQGKNVATCRISPVDALSTPRTFAP